MERESYDVLIVGGGHGGAQVAIGLRQRGFAGSIAIVGEEPDLPYERPPLSKEYLAGEKSFDRLLIRPPAFWPERRVAIMRGRRIVAVDPVSRTVVDHEGGRTDYGTLVWATGGHSRRLTCAGHDLSGVHTVRTRADVDQLLGELPSVARVAVVGAGYIGLEAAAALVKRGLSVTVLEAQPRVLARVAGLALSHFYQSEHRDHGVDLRLNAEVRQLEGVAGRVAGVRLGDGDVIAADLVIVGIGIVPATEPLARAGAEGDNGVLVDAFCRTSIADVYAAGDCALHANRFAQGAVIRLESVQNAADMANTVAASIVGMPQPYAAVPWFWSNQYDLKLQTVGLSLGHDEEIVRGDPATRSFSVVYRRRGRVIALDCVNATRDYVQGRALVLEGATVDHNMLADPAIPLKTLAS